MRNQPAIAIVAWKKLSRRSELLAEALGAQLWFFKDSVPYVKATLKTFLKTARKKPKILITQLPQGPLLLEAYLLKKLTGCKVAADVHTGFLVNTDWKGRLLNEPFVKLLSTADLIIAHNETQLRLIPQKLHEKTVVAFDPWHLLLGNLKSCRSLHEPYIVFPASFASDEPLEEVIRSINSHDLNVKMYVTGNWKRNMKIKKYATSKIIFTGYVPDRQYHTLLCNATAIITGTKREYTSLMSGSEALAYAKPLAVTATETLRSLFSGYAVFYDWHDSGSIAEAIRKATTNKPDMAAWKNLETQTVASLQELKQKLAQSV